jgi:hypothetical protein
MKKINKLIQRVVLVCILATSLAANAQTACDYNTSSVTFNIGTPGTLPSNSLTAFLLVDHATNLIAHISSTPTFSGITQTKVYDVYAFSYVNDNTVTGLTVGGLLSAVIASCSDISNPLTVRICPPFIPNPNCDYTTPTVTLNTVTTPPAGATTQYFLVNSSGIILQISATPTFVGLSGSQTYNVYAISYTGTISNLILGGNYSLITGACYDLSNPLPITVCVCKPICLPVSINKVR